MNGSGGDFSSPLPMMLLGCSYLAARLCASSSFIHSSYIQLMNFEAQRQMEDLWMCPSV